MNRKTVEERYGDILYTPHPDLIRPRMPREMRAAQFSPFAALTGFEEAVEEEARETDAAPELDEGRLEELDQILRAALHQNPRPQLAITWFRPDAKKKGGAYVTTRGTPLSLDPVGKSLTFRAQRAVEGGASESRAAGTAQSAASGGLGRQNQPGNGKTLNIPISNIVRIEPQT